MQHVALPRTVLDLEGQLTWATALQFCQKEDHEEQAVQLVR